MKIYTKNCIICNNEVKIKRIKWGTAGFRLVPIEGVRFLKKYFCEGCWEEIRRKQC